MYCALCITLTNCLVLQISDKSTASPVLHLAKQWIKEVKPGLETLQRGMDTVGKFSYTLGPEANRVIKLNWNTLFRKVDDLNHDLWKIIDRKRMETWSLRGREGR
jgi:hypothetical protein